MIREDWTGRLVAVSVTVSIAIGGWAFTLERRLQAVETTQQERAPRIELLESRLADLAKSCLDPAPRPEAKIAIESLHADNKRISDELTRLEDRVNNLHNYLLMLPVKPNPNVRGDRGKDFNFIPSMPTR